jgi:hypothetical protein
MMRICPKCSGYSADDSLAFCLADGTPLIGVDPNSETWSEGSRALKEKENGLRKRKRKMKWRLVLMSGMTVLIATMVVSRSVTVETVPAKETVPKKTGLTITPISDSHPVATPSPKVDIKVDTKSPATEIRVVNTNVNTNTNTHSKSNPVSDVKANGNANTHVNPQSSVNANTNVNPHSNANTNSNTNINSHTNVNTNTNVNPHSNVNSNTNSNTNVNADCSEADRSRAKKTILDRFSASWRRRIEGERPGIIARYARAGIETDASLSPIDFQTTVFKECMTALVTARYMWQIRTNSPGAPPKVLTVGKEKRFTCGRMGGTWLCY